MQNILKKMKISLILPIHQYILSKYLYLGNLVEKKGWVKVMKFSSLLFFGMYFLLLWKSDFKSHLKVENLIKLILFSKNLIYKCPCFTETRPSSGLGSCDD